MYSRTSPHSRVNAARQALFSQGRSIEAVPPTQAALEQHSRRAAYQAGHVWGRALDTMQISQVQQIGDGSSLALTSGFPYG